MSSFDEYQHKYPHAAMTRADNESSKSRFPDWRHAMGSVPPADRCRAFHDIVDDLENRVVILTGRR